LLNEIRKEYILNMITSQFGNIEIIWYINMLDNIVKVIFGFEIFFTLKFDNFFIKKKLNLGI